MSWDVGLLRYMHWVVAFIHFLHWEHSDIFKKHCCHQSYISVAFSWSKAEVLLLSQPRENQIPISIYEAFKPSSHLKHGGRIVETRSWISVDARSEWTAHLKPVGWKPCNTRKGKTGGRGIHSDTANIFLRLLEDINNWLRPVFRMLNDYFWIFGFRLAFLTDYTIH